MDKEDKLENLIQYVEDKDNNLFVLQFPHL